MKRNVAAIIYFDDTQIIGRIVKSACGSALKVLAHVRHEYSGIINSRFADRENFSTTLATVVHELAQSVAAVPETLFIAVPDVFCRVVTEQSEIEFDHLTKINKKHLQTLWDKINFAVENSEIIAQRALYFKVAELDEVMLDVLGLPTVGVQMMASAILVNNEFRPLIDVSALNSAGFTNFELLPLSACELFMLPEKQRDAGCTMVRSDFFTTSVVNVIGDGITHISHYDMGMGHIVHALAESFAIDYEAAIDLLRQCTPTYTTLLDETYRINGHNILMNVCNEIVLKQIRQFGERLANVEMARVVYLVGGNLQAVYGVRNLLANACGRRFYDAKDPLTGHTEYPENSLKAVARFVLEC